MAGAIERWSDQLGHPGVEHDLSLHLGAGAAADVEDAGHQPAGTGDKEASRLDDQPPRSPVDGDRLEERRELSRERSGRGPPAGGTTGPPPRSRVSKRSSPHLSRPRAPAADGPRHATLDGAELRSDVEVDPARDERAVASPATRSTVDVSSVSVMPNFEPAAPTASPAAVSGTTAGLRRNSTSSGGRSAVPSRARRAMAIRASASSGDRSRARPEAPRPLAHRAPQVGVGLADPLDRDPVVRDARARAIAHSPPDTTFAPRPKP